MASAQERGAHAVVDVHGREAAGRVELQDGMLGLHVVLRGVHVLEDHRDPAQGLESGGAPSLQRPGGGEAVGKGGLPAVARGPGRQEVQDLHVRRLRVVRQVRVQAQRVGGVRLVRGLRLDLDVEELAAVHGLPQRQPQGLGQPPDLLHLGRRPREPRDAVAPEGVQPGQDGGPRLAHHGLEGEGHDVEVRAEPRGVPGDDVRLRAGPRQHVAAQPLAGERRGVAVRPLQRELAACPHRGLRRGRVRWVGRVDHHAAHAGRGMEGGRAVVPEVDAWHGSLLAVREVELHGPLLHVASEQPPRPLPRGPGARARLRGPGPRSFESHGLCRAARALAASA
mmetsp:Transcript_24145/g.75960  ORF Transcript_24145/g.75960 Transcript_24145/m.75960 type:complete len:338 (-) Transcript_24145:21-1034(-)